MDIKIGFADTARELSFFAQGTHEEISGILRDAIASASTVELEDSKGAKYLINGARIVYVEIGSHAPRTVGFAGGIR